MQFKLFPNPGGGFCTPFISLKRDQCFARYYSNGKSFKRLTIKRQNGRLSYKTIGIDNHIISGERRPCKKIMINYCRDVGVSNLFLKYLKETIVVPTFALSFEEAFVRTIIRQLISAKQAKKIYSEFIKKYGYHRDGLYGFPNVKKMENISINELSDLGLGFKTKRFRSGIELIAANKTNEIFQMSGIGPWSRNILRVEIEKDYSYYPFWDISGDRIQSICRLDIRTCAKRNPELAGDLYIYAASYLESIR